MCMNEYINTDLMTSITATAQNLIIPQISEVNSITSNASGISNFNIFVIILIIITLIHIFLHLLRKESYKSLAGSTSSIDNKKISSNNLIKLNNNPGEDEIVTDFSNDDDQKIKSNIIALENRNDDSTSESVNTIPVSEVTYADEPDNLRKIEGIGVAIEAVLNENGIFTFNNLANCDISQLKDILNAKGSRFLMHDPSSWPKQAKLADDKQWDALKKLQDTLNNKK